MTREEGDCAFVLLRSSRLHTPHAHTPSSPSFPQELGLRPARAPPQPGHRLCAGAGRRPQGPPADGGRRFPRVCPHRNRLDGCQAGQPVCAPRLGDCVHARDAGWWQCGGGAGDGPAVKRWGLEESVVAFFTFYVITLNFYTHDRSRMGIPFPPPSQSTLCGSGGGGGVGESFFYHRRFTDRPLAFRARAPCWHAPCPLSNLPLTTHLRPPLLRYWSQREREERHSKKQTHTPFFPTHAPADPFLFADGLTTPRKNDRVLFFICVCVPSCGKK